MSKKVVLLPGQTFGNWTVLCESADSSGRQVRYLCRCICGIERSVMSIQLRSGLSKGCGKGLKCTRVVTVGQRFHRLTVVRKVDNIRRTARNPWGKAAVVCVCDCGVERCVGEQSLLNGTTKSCGCLQREVCGAPKPYMTTHGVSTNKMISEHGSRPRHLWDNYKLTLAEYDKLSEAQNNACAVCYKSDVLLYVDHDHACCPRISRRTCGKCVRGLLCSNCNSVLGKFRDNTDYMKAAIEYLRVYSSRCT